MAPDTRTILGKFFEVTPDTFNDVPRVAREQWVEDIRQPNYRLTHQQHCYLIGMGWLS